MTLGKQIALSKIKALSADGTSLVTSDTVDMQGFDGVLIFTTINVANAGNYMTAQQSADDSTYNDLEGTKVICTATNQVVALDIYRPIDRYIQVDVTRTSSTVLGEIYALQYGAHKKAPAHGSDWNIEYHASPAEGTA